MPPIVPTGVPDSSRGNSATVTMSREDLMAKTATQLKALLKEKGLPAGDAAKSMLVGRLLKGKKKAPKSNAERQATHKANRSEAKMEEDRDRNKLWMESSRTTRSQAKKDEDTARNKQQQTSSRANRS